MSKARLTNSLKETVQIQSVKLQQQLQRQIEQDARIIDLERKIKALEELAAHRMQSINGLIAEKETLLATNEQLAHELSMHEPSTDKLADLAAYCVQRKIGQSGQEAHEAMMAHCDALADHLARVLQTYGDNSGFEPSLSVFQREIDRARDYMAKRQGGAE